MDVMPDKTTCLENDDKSTTRGFRRDHVKESTKKEEPNELHFTLEVRA